MKKETYLVIGSDSIEDLRRIAFSGNAAGVNLIVLGDAYSFTDTIYEKIEIYKMGLNALLSDNLSGVVLARCSYTMESNELTFWNYMEQLAKRMGLKILQEWELRKPKKIDFNTPLDFSGFEDLKTPSVETQNKLNNISSVFHETVQKMVKSTEKTNNDIKDFVNGLHGFKFENSGNETDSGKMEFREYPDVIHIDSLFPGPDRPIIDIDISIGGGRDSRGDQNGKHGGRCNDCAGGSGKPRSGWDASCSGCGSKPV